MPANSLAAISTNRTDGPCLLRSLLSFVFVESWRGLNGDLDLLRAPRSIRIPHVGWRLNAGNELEYNVCDSNHTNDGAWDILVPVAAHDNGAEEKID